MLVMSQLKRFTFQCFLFYVQHRKAGKGRRQENLFVLSVPSCCRKPHVLTILPVFSLSSTGLYCPVCFPFIPFLFGVFFASFPLSSTSVICLSCFSLPPFHVPSVVFLLFVTTFPAIFPSSSNWRLLLWCICLFFHAQCSTAFSKFFLPLSLSSRLFPLLGGGVREKPQQALWGKG